MINDKTKLQNKIQIGRPTFVIDRFLVRRPQKKKEARILIVLIGLFNPYYRSSHGETVSHTKI